MTLKQRRNLSLASCAGAVTMPGALILGYPGVMAPFWQQAFSASKGDIGTAVFGMFATVGVVGFLAGKMYARRGVRPAILLGGLICGLNLLAAAWADNFYYVYFWCLFNGVAVGAVWNAAVTSAQHWFPGRRGLVSGVVTTAFGGSAVVLVPLLAYLLHHVGYFELHLYLGGFALLLGVASTPLSEMPQRVPGAIPEPAGERTQEAGHPGPSYTVGQSLRSKNFWLIWLTYALQGAAGISMLTFATAYGLARGYGLEAAVFILFCFNVTNTLSRIVTGYISDRMSRGLVMSLSFWAAGAAYLLLPLAPVWGVAVACASLVGFAFGTLLTVTVPLTGDCFGMENFGAIYGLIFTAFGFASGAMGPSLGGFILDRTNGNFTILFVYLGALCLLSGVLARFISPPARPAGS